MTDRCATNIKVDANLESLKGAALNSMRCGAHPLDTFQSACEKAVRSYEKDHPPPPSGLFTKHSESVCHCLIRKAGDLFHNDQTGCKQLLSAHLASTFPGTHYQTGWIQAYRGNRWNIDCRTAAHLYMYYDAMLDFFSSVHHPTNDLQRAIYSTLKGQAVRVPLRALGLVLRYITGPWLCLVEQPDLRILDLNEPFAHARQVLSQWMEDPSAVVSGTAPETVFAGIQPDTDNIFKCLTKSVSESADALTGQLFAQFCTNICDVMDRQLGDQLPGGKFHNPTAELLAQTQSCAATNVSGERSFGKVDAAIHHAPNVNVAKVEAKTMFSSNRTTDWLAAKNPEERNVQVNMARQQAAHVRSADKERKQDLKTQVQHRLQFKRVQLQERDEKKRDVTEKLVEEALKSGLWTAETLDEKLAAGKSATKKKTLLRAQISYYTKILGVKSEQKIAVTKATIQELKDHVLGLMKLELSADQQEKLNVLNNAENLVGRHAQHTWSVDGLPVQFEVTIVRYHVANDEFEMQCGGEHPYFQTRPELLTDVLRGDMVLH